MQSSIVNDVVRSALGGFFAVENVGSITPLGNGNINDTYLVIAGRRKFVLQRINSAVFPNPEGVAANFALVSRHIHDVSRTSSIDVLCSQPVLARTGGIVYRDEQGGCWRAQSYIEHIPFSQFQFDRSSASQLGQVLARFHLLTADLDIARLIEPLPEFHVTPCYLRQYDETVARWRGDLSTDLRRCFHHVDAYRPIAGRLEEARRNGHIHRRTIHGDPKLDNVIFTSGGQAMGLFDLDTTGPGLLHYDLGDCLRSCCNRAGEDSGWESVRFDLDICEAVLSGYLKTAGETLSRWDTHLIYDAILILSFELGLRFLTDHLRGDIYFKVTSPGNNLRRALGQFRLADAVAAQEKKIRTCIATLGGEYPARG